MRSRSMVHILYELSLASIGSFCREHYILVELCYSKLMPLLSRISQCNSDRDVGVPLAPIESQNVFLRELLIISLHHTRSFISWL